MYEKHMMVELINIEVPMVKYEYLPYIFETLASDRLPKAYNIRYVF